MKRGKRHEARGKKQNMKKRLALWLLATLFLANVSLADAQQTGKVPRIGFLSTTSASNIANNLEAFRQGLRESGYIEGKNIIIEYRWAEGKLDRLPELAAELVSLGVDIIVTGGTPPVLAAKKATNTIPIVAANADNLVELGVVASLARPGNVTGSTRVDADFSAKRLELLKESFPKLSRVAVLSHGALGGRSGGIARDPGCGADSRGSGSVLHGARA
jgi:putative tryptophan/tyrosine transport system substrate-binding protein